MVRICIPKFLRLFAHTRLTLSLLFLAAPLNWVCNYPDSSDGRGNTAMTRAEWAAADYDYFASLNATFKTDSYNNKGPCYPVLLVRAFPDSKSAGLFAHTRPAKGRLFPLTVYVIHITKH